MASRRRRSLRAIFGVVSLATTLLLLVLGGVALRSVAVSHRSATDAARADLAALEDASQLQALLYQKGFVAEYFLTGNRHWLDELASMRGDFDRWIAQVTQHAGSTPELARITAELVAEYGRYDADRARAVADFDLGHHDAALRALLAANNRGPTLRELSLRLIRVRREEVAARLQTTDRVWAQAQWTLALVVALAIAGAVGSGYLLARRVARPLYDLVLRAESAAAGARVEITADDEIGALSEHVAHLARTIESSSTALAEQRARLVQAEKMSALGEMATAVAHELLNPLTGVKMALQLLQRTNGAPDVAETVQSVDVEVRRVEQMARRLMKFAVPATPRPERVALPELWPRIVAAARSEADARQLHVTPALDEASLLTADPDLLTQMLINLVVNACQATPAGGDDVVVRTRAERGWRVVEVSDGGRGLSQNVAARLFSPFVTDRPEGHGLGLAISQNIALAHGGRIDVRDHGARPGVTFAVWLPEPTEAAA